MSRRLAVIAGLMLLATAQISSAADIPDNWDGLVRVKAKRMDAVFLMPDADFRPYTKVMIDKTVVAFRKNWQRDVNRQQVGLGGRVSDSDARRILDAARDGFEEIFAKAYRKIGYQVVTEPGPDVLRLSTAVINLDVAAPDVMSAGRTRTYARTAGAGQLVLEARDSLSGAVLGRAIDGRETRDIGPYLRNSVTNSAAFEQLFTDWARISAQGIGELKALSPVDVNGVARR